MKPVPVALTLVLLAGSPIYAQETRSYDDRAKITVTGDAVVNVKPDKITISFGIETSDKQISVAKQKNDDIWKKAVAAFKECGVPEKEIQTDHLSLEPRYKPEYERENFLGYFVRNTLVVTLDDTAKVEELVTKALEAGVNYIHGIDFQTTELKKAREQARELALKAAKEKAEKMAAVLGQSVGKPIFINENQTGSPWGYNSSWWGWGYGRDRGVSQSQNVRERGGGTGEVSETIALGKISIRANATVTFELKDEAPNRAQPVPTSRPHAEG